MRDAPQGAPLTFQEHTMEDPFDASLLDQAALDEIETTSRLMIAASGCSRHLSQYEVDQLLGIATDS